MPVVGSAAAVADAGLYLYEGDPVSAALSLTAVVPGGAILAQGGRALKAAKGAEEALTVVNDINKTEKAIKGADEAVDVFNDVGKVEKAAKQAEEAERLATDASRAEKAAAGAKPPRWRVGDSIDSPTAAGKPSWTTVQSRYWKNEASANPTQWTKGQLERMGRGRAPLHPDLEVPMELHHWRIPQRFGGPNTLWNLLPVWPWEHAAMDAFRHYHGPRPI